MRHKLIGMLSGLLVLLAGNAGAQEATTEAKEGSFGHLLPMSMGQTITVTEFCTNPGAQSTLKKHLAGDNRPAGAWPEVYRPSGTSRAWKDSGGRSWECYDANVNVSMSGDQSGDLACTSGSGTTQCRVAYRRGN